MWADQSTHVKRDLTTRFCTIGYEGVTLGCFLATLKAARVTQLLDVRELPISRRKGFSKNALSTALTRSGIAYVHQRALGSPRALRHRLRKDRDLARFMSDFREYLATQQVTLDTLVDESSGVVALLCYEREPSECHRSIVASVLAKRTRTVVQHLMVPLNGQQASGAARPNTRQGVSAA